MPVFVIKTGKCRTFSLKINFLQLIISYWDSQANKLVFIHVKQKVLLDQKALYDKLSKYDRYFLFIKPQNNEILLFLDFYRFKDIPFFILERDQPFDYSYLSLPLIRFFGYIYL